MDLGKWVDSTLPDFFNMVKNIPYTQDSNLFEVVARPKYLLDSSKFPKLDCKKKATLIAAWLIAHGYKWVPTPEKASGPSFVFVGLSEEPSRQIHHIFPAKVSGGFIEPLDATYAEFKIGEGKPLATEARFLP